jgi:hypothetical protein
MDAVETAPRSYPATKTHSKLRRCVSALGPPSKAQGQTVNYVGIDLHKPVQSSLMGNCMLDIRVRPLLNTSRSFSRMKNRARRYGTLYSI